MGEKDITQKNFEAYNDVVADIVNGSLFDGQERIKAESLVDAHPFSQYKELMTVPSMSRNVMLQNTAWI